MSAGSSITSMPTRVKGRQLRVGIDIVSLDDVRQLVANPRARNTVFSPEEISWCEGRREDALAAFARTFAIKEAAVKALESPEGKLRRVRVLRRSGKAPRIEWKELDGAESVTVSTSFSAPFAIAVVAVLR